MRRRLARLSSRHWVALGLAVSGVAASMHAAHSWAEVLSPSGVAGILQSIGAVLVAIFSDRPSSGAGISPSRFIDKEPS